MEMRVKKRDGRLEAIDFDKIHRVITWAAEGLNDVSVSQVEMNARIQFYDGIPTKEVHEMLIKSAANLIDEAHSDYQYLAARLKSFHLRKIAYKQYQPPELYDHIVNLTNMGKYDKEILESYSKEEIDDFGRHLNHDKDMKLAYAAFDQFETKYLVQDRTTKQVYETPQFAYMLIAMVLFSSYKENRSEYVKKLYDNLSDFKISFPTPIMSGVRTPTRQFSSCVKIDVGDSLDSINAANNSVVKYVSQKAGIGINYGKVRAVGSPIRGGDAEHTGLIPFIKTVGASVKSCCLTPDTYVEILDENRKTKKIQLKDLVVGDMIKTKNERGEIVFERVVKKWDTLVQKSDQVYLKFANGVELNCSVNHPIMCLGEEGFIEVKPLELTKEHIVLTDDVSFTSVIEIRCGDECNDENYIDIEVENTHTFFASASMDGEMVLTHNSQGGVRGGAATLTYPIWHYEFSDLVVLKNNRGVEENRERRLDYAVQLNRFFLDRFINGKDISFFSPSDVDGLYEAFYQDQELFAKLYEQYEADSSIRRRTMPAKEAITLLINERLTTGRIYINFVDNMNEHSAFDKFLNFVSMSNLCQEIALPTKPMQHIEDIEGEIALCTLAAFNLGEVKDMEKFSDFAEWADLVVRALDALLSYQNYPVKPAEYWTKRRRSLGIGVINFAYFLAKNGKKYSDGSGFDLTHRMMESMQYHLIKASVNLAKEQGKCEAFDLTTYSKGILPIDTYKKEVDEVSNVPLQYDWEALREEVVKYGMRNSTLTAFMPSETSSIISNSTSGLDPVRSLVTAKQSKDGIRKQVVPEIEKYFTEYEKMWDIKKMENYLKLMGVIQKFTDQAISTNTWYDPENYPNKKVPIAQMIKDLMLAYRYGLKTLYYNHTRDDSDRDDDDCLGGGCKI